MVVPCKVGEIFWISCNETQDMIPSKEKSLEEDNFVNINLKIFYIWS